MSICAPQLNSHVETLESLTPAKKQLKQEGFLTAKESYLLQAIIERFVDGVLIVTENGECIYANDCARRVCQQLSRSPLQSNSLPQPIWQVCESLCASRQLFPDRKIILESEVDLENSATFRTRARWLDLGENNNPYIMVTIEDRSQSTQNQAISEANKYGLTPREAEVWLLRRANYSYKEIAQRLYITLNTVKKHMKNVYAKQQQNFEECEIDYPTSEAYLDKIGHTS